MLHDKLIVRGPEGNYDIPEKLQFGEYMVQCLKKRDPNEIFCVDGVTNESWTCAEFVKDVLKVAHILRSLGIVNGDIVSIVCENSVRYIVPIIAIMYIGAAPSLLNPIYSTGELKRALDITKSRLAICTKTALGNLNSVKSDSEYLEKVLLLEEEANVEGVENLQDLIKATTVDLDTIQAAKTDGDDLALVLLSSGTTGLPKCVMITHKNLRTPAGSFGDPAYVGIKSSDSTIAVLPFFHIFGASTILAATVYSMKLIVLPVFLPEVYLKCIQTHKISAIYAVPPMVSFLVKHPIVQKFDLSSIKWIFCSGGCLGTEVQDEFTRRYPHISIRQLYGLTEMVGPCTISQSFDTSRPGSVGVIIPDTEAIIWNKELGENVGPLAIGELCFRGSSVMKGYIEREDNDIDENRFYHTGDLGYYDEEGHFYIVGRMKELIKYKGFQVAPAELEDLIMKHDAVAECGVIGIPDERAGQLPTAVIVKQKNANVTEKEIIDFVAERISVHKHLHGGVKFTDAIPRNAAGKILRNKLYELYKTL